MELTTSKKGLSFTLTLVVVGVILLMTALTVITLGGASLGDFGNWIFGQQASTSAEAACRDLARQVNNNYCDQYVTPGDCSTTSDAPSSGQVTATAEDCDWEANTGFSRTVTLDDGRSINCVDEGYFADTTCSAPEQ